MKDWCPLVVSEYKKNLPAASCWRRRCPYLAAKKGVKVATLGTLHRHSCSQRMNINDNSKWFWFVKPSLSCANLLNRDLVRPTSSLKKKNNKKCARFRLAVDCEMCFESYLPDCREKLCIKKKIKPKFPSSPLRVNSKWLARSTIIRSNDADARVSLKAPLCLSGESSSRRWLRVSLTYNPLFSLFGLKHLHERAESLF